MSRKFGYFLNWPNWCRVFNLTLINKGRTHTWDLLSGWDSGDTHVRKSDGFQLKVVNGVSINRAGSISKSVGSVRVTFSPNFTSHCVLPSYPIPFRHSASLWNRNALESEGMGAPRFRETLQVEVMTVSSLHYREYAQSLTTHQRI